MVTVPSATGLVSTSSPTAGKAIELLCRLGILQEVTGKRRDRVYAYQAYLNVLAEDTGTSGKTRIQILPTRRILRVIARRAASIWRAVIRSGAMAFKP